MENVTLVVWGETSHERGFWWYRVLRAALIEPLTKEH
jgi:hypothetical protein